MGISIFEDLLASEAADRQRRIALFVVEDTNERLLLAGVAIFHGDIAALKQIIV